MKIALSSYSGIGAWFALRLKAEGHLVDYYLSEPKYEGVLRGLVPMKPLELDHRKSFTNYVSGLPDYSKYDVSVFDLTGRKRQAEASAMLTPTIGDGLFHCLLEDDRAAGIQLMEEAGISVPPYEEFTELGAAKAHIKKTGKRYVFKPDSQQEQDTATTYVSKSAEDLLEYIDKLGATSKGAKFILQEFIAGIEISTEGWFNGEDFYCLNCTLEEKKFMNDNIGPNTGCAGNLVFSINHNNKLYREGLEKVKPLLQRAGFKGMIDLNTIVTETNVYGLEWTPRFGYDATATFATMYGGNFGELLERTAKGDVPEEAWRSEFAVSTRLSIPPYPTELKLAKSTGLPFKGLSLDNVEDIAECYLYDVELAAGTLQTAGVSGFVAAPIVLAAGVSEAFDAMEERVKSLSIPDMQYRTDLKSSIGKRYYELERMGWI